MRAVLPMKMCLVSFVLSTLAIGAGAAVPTKINNKPRFLEGNASQNGGVAGSGFTLLDMRRSSDAKKKIERVVLDVGDMKGAPHAGLPGYFHVELKENPNRLVIDMAQMPNTKVDEKKLMQIFAKSIAVKRTSMTVDPSDNTLNIALDLKSKTKVRVLQVPGQKQTSKIVIDMVVR